MKKSILIYICLLVIITSSLVIINKVKDNSKLHKSENIQNDEVKNKEIEDKINIESKANEIIRVRITNTGEIVAMDINDYLRGVVPAEMPPYYEIEALKAQAIVARTYTYRKMSTSGEGADADMCDNHAHCQAFYNKDKLFEIWRKKGYDENTIHEYWNKVNEAVVSTQNQVIMYQGNYIKAFFHASSPIRTEDISQIWGGESLPYLVSVENNEVEDYPNRTSCSSFKYTEFIEKIKNSELNISNLTIEEVKATCINEYTTSGRVKNIKVGSYIVSAEKLRTIFGLKSTQFTIKLNEDNICFDVIGYGHGVGMSQVGANTYAKEGKNYIDIINKYYTNVDIVTMPSN